MDHTRYVVVDDLVITRRGKWVLVESPVAGVTLECSDGVLRAVEAFRTPATLKAAARAHGMTLAETTRAVAPLVDALIVVPQQYAAALKAGSVCAPTRVIGRALPITAVRDQAVRGGVALIGAPVRAGAGAEGTPNQGPSLVRNAMQQALFAERDHELALDLDFRRQYRARALPVVFDLGDVVYDTGEALTTFGARLEFVADRALRAGLLPATVGGDHSITRFLVSAALRHHPHIGVIHFDAHHDLYDGLRPRRPTHANPFSYLLDEKGVNVLFQVGLRTAFEMITTTARAVRHRKITYASAMECQSSTAARVFATLPRNIPYYLSVDIDVVDPVFAPETGTPVSGGLSYYQCLRLVDYAARRFNLIGVDMVEVSGSERRHNLAAQTAARLLTQVLLGRAPFRRLQTHLYT